MQFIKSLLILLKKDVTLEWRNKFTISGLLLYACSTVFVIYMAFNSVKPTTWITLFWIVTLFTISNSSSRAFLNSFNNKTLYYYQLVSPLPFIFSKIVLNIILVWLVTAITILLFALLLKYPIANSPIFLLSVAEGVTVLSITFTFISAIAHKAGNAGFLVPILSFPLIIPIIGLLIGVSTDAITGVIGINFWFHNQIIWAITVLTLVLIWILFPYLWKE